MIAYDDGDVPYAARIVWMLEYYGHDEAYVLAGGLPAWVASGGAIETAAPVVTPAEKLEALVAGLDRAKRTIVSCGSGVSASGSYFALREAGFTDVAVYDGSWMEWSHDGLPTVEKAAG